MRRMADDSKSTIIALTLELMRIEINNDHMRNVISYLGQAVINYLCRSAYVNTWEECHIHSGITDSYCLRRYFRSITSPKRTSGIASTANHHSNSSTELCRSPPTQKRHSIKQWRSTTNIPSHFLSIPSEHSFVGLRLSITCKISRNTTSTSSTRTSTTSALSNCHTGCTMRPRQRSFLWGWR